MAKITEVGEVVSVTGNYVTVSILDSLKSNMPMIDGIVYRIGQIGSFLKISLGYSMIYGIVTQMGAQAMPKEQLEIKRSNFDSISNNQWLTLVLIGEQIGKNFDRGVSQYPTAGDKVHLVTISDLNIIYGGYDDKSSVEIGNISVSESLTAKIDLDKIIARHCAIVGSTGSGKSNAVSVLLNAIVTKNYRCPRVIVIDPHGEYDSTLVGFSKVFKINSKGNENELLVPYWALPFNELLSIFSGNITDQNKEYIREKVLELKIESNEVNDLKIPDEIITADSPIPFSIKRLWFDLDDFERKTFGTRGVPESEKLIEKGSPEELKSSKYEPAAAGGGSPFLNQQAKGVLGFLESVRIRLKDSRYNFLFNPNEYNPGVNGFTNNDLNELLYSWLGGPEPITILDLSGIPSEIMISISGTILKIIYDALFWGQNLDIGGKEQPLFVVLEEAHNYLKAGEKSVASRTVQMIAKEGRKYGVGLLLATQRPSELDETVLSQCGTIIALRMNNSRDRGHIQSSIQDELSTLVDLLPSLRTGEGIISGEGVKIPTRVKFYKSKNAPKGSDPLISEKWVVAKDITADKYKGIVDNWRNQKF